jgi:acetyl esterase/lipase
MALMSGGWVSSRDGIRPENMGELLRRGYTVFAVVHGSQPKFQIQEITLDIERAARFIRTSAERFHIDSAKMGVTGGSAGCHLSLMLATRGGPGKADAKDPIDRASSAVQATACFFPPTDFLNYGQPGAVAVGVGLLRDFRPAFGARADDPDDRRWLGREISPIYFITPKLPPTLLIHGDADKLVPIQQAETFVAKARSAGAKARLVTKPGKGHGWPEMADDQITIADWFDEHLRGLPGKKK